MPALPGSLRLEGDGVVLRDWRTADAPALEPVCGEWDVSSFTSVPWDFSEEAARAWVRRQAQKRAAGTVLALAILESGRQVPVGNVNLGGFEDGRRSASVGYWLAPEARGRGLAAAAVGLLVDWGFGEMGLRRVEFAILPRNAASRRLAERLGAVHEGLRENSHHEHGRPWDMEIYAIEREGGAGRQEGRRDA